MMKKSVTRIISLLLAVLITIPTSLPVFAEETEQEQPQIQAEEIADTETEQTEGEEAAPAAEEEASVPAEEEEPSEITPEEPVEEPVEETAEEPAESEPVVEETETEVPEEAAEETTEDISLAASTLPDEVMDLTKAKVELVDTAPIVYDGKAKEPDFILVYQKDEASPEYRVILKDLKTVCNVAYTNNINAGTGNITIIYKEDEGKEKITNKLVAEFTIEKAGQSLKATVPAAEMYVYDTQQITVTGAVGTLSYASSNKNVLTVTKKGVITAVGSGTATITVTAAGDANHNAGKATVTVKAVYENINIANTTITLEDTEFPYTAKAIEPAVTVEYKNRALVEGVDYKLTYSSNTKVGTAKVVIEGIGYNSGKVTKKFEIVKSKNPITASSVSKLFSLEAQSFTLNASAKEGATLTFKSSNKDAIKIDANTGKVTIKAGYMGSAKITITAAETENYLETTKTVTVYARYMTKTRILEYIKGIMASWDGAGYGSARYQQIINTYNAYADQIGAGKMQTNYAWCAATVSAAWITAGIAKYTGIEMSCGRFINIAKSNDAWNSDWKSVPKVGDAIIYSWDGSHSSHDHVGMVIAVSKDKKTFTTIEGNTNGSGMYNGEVGCFTRSVSYKYIQGFISYDYSDIANKMKYIKKIDDDDIISVSSISAKNYTGSAIKPAVTIKDTHLDKTLVAGTDYTLYYSNNTAPGTATVTIVGKGNYTGVRSLNFKITAKYAWYHVIETSVRYRTGPGTGYSVAGTFKKNQNVKVVKGTSTKANGYTWYAVQIGSKTYYAASMYLKKGKYTSSTISITDDSITVAKISNKSYANKALKPSVTIKHNGTKLVKGTDYTLSYKNNKLPGTATVTITGIGKYTGTRKVTFKIVGKYTTYTTKYALNYRSKPSTSGTIKGTFAQGAKVSVLNGYSKSANGYTWVIVKVGTKFYYTAKNYLK